MPLHQSEAAMLRTELEDNKLLSSERWQSLLKLKPLIRRPGKDSLPDDHVFIGEEFNIIVSD